MPTILTPSIGTPQIDEDRFPLDISVDDRSADNCLILEISGRISLKNTITGVAITSQDDILTISEVAGLLKVAEKTVYAHAQKEELPSFKVGGQWASVEGQSITGLKLKRRLLGQDRLFPAVKSVLLTSCFRLSESNAPSPSSSPTWTPGSPHWSAVLIRPVQSSKG